MLHFHLFFFLWGRLGVLDVVLDERNPRSQTDELSVVVLSSFSLLDF